MPESSCIDVTKTLQKHVEEGMYYKTDHHWTSRAAAYAFNAAAVELGSRARPAIIRDIP